MPAESRRVTRSRSGDSSAASAPVAASRAPAQPPTRKRARGARGDKEQQEQEAAEEGAEEEEDGNDGASSNGDDDDSDDGEDEEEEDEGELIFAGRSVRGEWVSGTLTYADSKRLHYRGEFKNGVKHGQGELFFPDGSTLKGPFVDDEICGVATYTGADSSRIVGRYIAGGVLDGEVVEYDDDGVEVFRGMYRDSERHGPGTVTLPDGGQLVGEFVHGVFHGDANKYLYPRVLDEEASLRGRWHEGQLERAQFYLGEKLVDPEVSYSFDESTATRISSHPLLPDPYEQRCVYVAPSTTPNSGEGLFALRDLPGNTVVTWYSGTRDKGYKAERRKWSENSNTISLIDDDPDGHDIDIDVADAWSLTTAYCASLAHKCNHDFEPAKQNAKYDMALHPRFGLIKSIRTTRPVPKDEELFVDYGYTLKLDPKSGLAKGKAGPDWYRAAFNDFHQKKKQANNNGTDTTSSSKSASTTETAASSTESGPPRRRQRR